MRRLVVLCLAVLGLVLTIQLPAQASARMQFGEIWYNSPGSDRGGAASLDPSGSSCTTPRGPASP